MSQNAGPFGATAPDIQQNGSVPSNPFSAIQIPDTPPTGFTAQNVAPSAPTTGVIQTQNSGFNMNAVMNQPTAGSEDTIATDGGGAQTMNAFANMLSNQPQQSQSSSPFNVQIPPASNPAPSMPVTNPAPNMPVTHPAPGFPAQTGMPQQYNQSPFNNGYNQQAQQKYNIVDLYWLINPKLVSNNLGGEAPMIIVSYNADFNNLALRFTAINQFASQSALCVKDLVRQGTVNLYSEHCMELLYLPVGQNINIIERAFNLNNWHPNTSVFTRVDENNLLVQSSDMNGQQYSFTFTGWQYNALWKSLEFMTSGSSWIMSLQCKTNR